MPMYEYQCDSCGQVFEVIQKFSDPPLKSCRICKGKKVRKLLGAPALQFKGSGFYITDYAGKNAANNTEGKADKSESKPESKTSGPACACKSGGCGSK